MKKILRSIRFGLRGLHHAYRADKSFRMEIYLGLPIYIVLGWFLYPFQPLELIIYIFSYMLILVIELLNTAFEKMIDRVHPQEHELIGRSKDMAAAAVLVTFLFAAIVVAVLVYVRLSSDVPWSVVRSFA